MKCPHCESVIPQPPSDWAMLPPWQCSHCSEMYGVSFHGKAFRIPQEIKPLWPLFTYMEARRFDFYARSRVYVYALCYPSGLPFYVGKGVRNRAISHVEEVWRLPVAKWTEKHRLIEWLGDRNEAEWYHFLALVDSHQEAEAIEQAYIERWGCRSKGGMLANRVRPAKSEAVKSIPDPVECLDVVQVSSQPRQVHHPSVFDGRASGNVVDIQCHVCLAKCYCPTELFAKVVQCPECAHYFQPGNAEKLIEMGRLFREAT